MASRSASPLSFVVLVLVAPVVHTLFCYAGWPHVASILYCLIRLRRRMASQSASCLVVVELVFRCTSSDSESVGSSVDEAKDEVGESGDDEAKDEAGDHEATDDSGDEEEEVVITEDKEKSQSLVDLLEYQCCAKNMF